VLQESYDMTNTEFINSNRDRIENTAERFANTEVIVKKNPKR